MDNMSRQKPSHEEWLHWSQIVVDRLTIASHVYSRNSHKDHAITETERQQGNAWVVETLRRYHKLLDGTDTPTESLAEVAHHDERVVDGLAVLVRYTLNHLPNLSLDMQKLLDSHWYNQFNGLLAEELFLGKLEGGIDGLGSGDPQHGRMPSFLNKLLTRERIEGPRMPREALLRVGRPSPNDDVRRRWADVNSRFMRSAGRIE